MCHNTTSESDDNLDKKKNLIFQRPWLCTLSHGAYHCSKLPALFHVLVELKVMHGSEVKAQPSVDRQLDAVTAVLGPNLFFLDIVRM